MTSVWQRLSVLDKVCEALGEVTVVNPDGHSPEFTKKFTGHQAGPYEPLRTRTTPPEP